MSDLIELYSNAMIDARSINVEDVMLKADGLTNVSIEHSGAQIDIERDDEANKLVVKIVDANGSATTVTVDANGRS